MDWYRHVNTTVQRIIQEEQENLKVPTSNEDYNSDLTAAELSKSTFATDPNSAPGPDKVLPKMITNSGKNSQKALLSTCQKAWAAGIHPDPWKRESRLFIPKSDKKSYNTTTFEIYSVAKHTDF